MAAVACFGFASGGAAGFAFAASQFFGIDGLLHKR